MFHTFPNQEERRKFGGSDFFEIQFCKLPQKTEVKIIGGDEQNLFIEEYACIFDCGIYNNLETGSIDPYGINYYGPGLIDPLIAKLLKLRPTDYERLVEWLDTAKKYNGFYILGV